MGPGTVAHLEEGEDIKFGAPNIPTAGFDAFVKTFCKLIGAGLGIPYDVLIKEYNSSYSSAGCAAGRMGGFSYAPEVVRGQFLPACL